MKLFFHGFIVVLGCISGIVLGGCGTNSGGGGFSLDTPTPRAAITSEGSPNPESFFSQPQPESRVPRFRPSDTESFFTTQSPSQTNVARFRVGQTINVIFSGAPAGDVLQSQLHDETIKEDGTITLPYIGSIYVLGKTAGELQNEIYTNYVPKYYVRLTVTVKPGDRVFYVGGEVGHSGVFQYISDTTATKAIQAAGGLTPFSSHNRIWLTHANNGKRIRVNYDEALKNPAKDPPVYPDDQINVEPSIF